MISLTSTSSGWSIAKAIARPIASAGMAVLSTRWSIQSLVDSSQMELEQSDPITIVGIDFGNRGTRTARIHVWRDHDARIVALIPRANLYRRQELQRFGLYQPKRLRLTAVCQKRDKSLRCVRRAR